jgi:hypothetical protein
MVAERKQRIVVTVRENLTAAQVLLGGYFMRWRDVPVKRGFDQVRLMIEANPVNLLITRLLKADPLELRE